MLIRGTVTQGVDLSKGEKEWKVKVYRAREQLARKSAWRESYFLAAFSPIAKGGPEVPSP
jgi:hypothetical protein